MSNEIRANYSNQRVGEKLVADNFGGAKPIPDSQLFPPGTSSTDGAFLLFIAGAGEYGQGKLATDEQRQINLVDNFALSAGSHQLKFGVDYRWLSPFSNPFSYQQFAEFLGVQCPLTPTDCSGYAPSATAAFADVETAPIAGSIEHDHCCVGAIAAADMLQQGENYCQDDTLLHTE